MSTGIPSNVARSLAVAQAAAPQLSKLKDTAAQMESIFVKNLLSEMSKGQGKGMFGDAPGSEIYQDMFTQTIAESVSKTGTFGIAKSIVDQLSKQVMQEQLAKIRLATNSSATKLDLNG